MQEKIDQLRRGLFFGLENGKRNMIVDLDVLAAMFAELDALKEWKGEVQQAVIAIATACLSTGIVAEKKYRNRGGCS